MGGGSSGGRAAVTDVVARRASLYVASVTEAVVLLAWAVGEAPTPVRFLFAALFVAVVAHAARLRATRRLATVGAVGVDVARWGLLPWGEVAQVRIWRPRSRLPLMTPARRLQFMPVTGPAPPALREDRIVPARLEDAVVAVVHRFSPVPVRYEGPEASDTRADRVRPWTQRLGVAGVVAVSLAMVPVPGYEVRGPASASRVTVAVGAGEDRRVVRSQRIHYLAVWSLPAFVGAALWTEFAAEGTLVHDESGFARDDLQRAARVDNAAAATAAVAAALRHLGCEAVVMSGVEVIAVADRSPARAAVRPGDVIVAIDGEPTPDRHAFEQRLLARPGGAVLTVRSGGGLVGLRAERVPTRTGLGLLLANSAVEVAGTNSPEVALDVSSRLGGPSSGLAWALSVLEALDTSTTPGPVVAATGTIRPDGTVGPVGDIEVKAAAARRLGADVLLVPVGQDDEARRRSGPRLQVVPVGTLGEAAGIVFPVGLRPAVGCAGT